jgi:hypothetical protein
MPQPLTRSRIRLAALLAGAVILPASASAQRADTLRTPTGVRVERPTIVRTDSAPRPPISPRRAFLYSLAAPGSAQVILGRPRTAAIFVGVEALAIVLARKSANDLREAKRYVGDSVVATYQIDATTGRAVLDSLGLPIPLSYLPGEFTRAQVDARRTHLEDWVTALLFNHLISGAEAFVSAHLWDLPAQISTQQRMNRTFLVARIEW